MSNWLGVEHQPAKILWGGCSGAFRGATISSNGNLRIEKGFAQISGRKFQEGEPKRMMGWKMETLVSNKQYIYILCICLYYVYVSISNPNPCIPLWDSPPKKPSSTIDGRVVFTTSVLWVLRWVMAISIGCGAPTAFLLLSCCSMAFDAMHLLCRATLRGILGVGDWKIFLILGNALCMGKSRKSTMQVDRYSISFLWVGNCQSFEKHNHSRGWTTTQLCGDYFINHFKYPY